MISELKFNCATPSASTYFIFQLFLFSLSISEQIIAFSKNKFCDFMFVNFFWTLWIGSWRKVFLLIYSSYGSLIARHGNIFVYALSPEKIIEVSEPYVSIRNCHLIGRNLSCDFCTSLKPRWTFNGPIFASLIRNFHGNFSLDSKRQNSPNYENKCSRQLSVT